MGRHIIGEVILGVICVCVAVSILFGMYGVYMGTKALENQAKRNVYLYEQCLQDGHKEYECSHLLTQGFDKQ